MIHAANSADLTEALEYVRGIARKSPDIALILGSGLGALADRVEDQVVIPTSSIPHYPTSTVPGHHGRLVVGTLGGRRVVVVQGRVHMYEGYAPEKVIFPVRLVRGMGARNLIVTNAAGGIRSDLHPGSLMWITDHIDWTFGRGTSVGVGTEQKAMYEMSESGSRVRGFSDYYSVEWIRSAAVAAKEDGIETTEGTYLWTRGPSYETPAEIRAFKLLGADTVGMSTVPEVVEACRLSMTVAGLSTVTNYAAGISNEKLDHKEVLEVGRRVRKNLEQLILFLIRFAPATTN